MSKALTGKCLCGSVTFSALAASEEMDVCHCSKCRKWSGGVLFAVPCAELHIDNEAALGVYQSSEWGERLFCKTCGSNLFWRMQDHSMQVVMAQAFDDPSQFTFSSEAFIDEKPANYAFANNTRQLTGEEFMAMYSSDK